MKIRHIAAAMAATLVVAVPTAAFAGGSPYIVSVGGSAVGASGHPITASSTGAVQVSARNLSSTVVNMNCTWAAMTGTVTSGTAVNPVLSFPALATNFTGCSVPGGPVGGGHEHTAFAHPVQVHHSGRYRCSDEHPGRGERPGQSRSRPLAVGVEAGRTSTPAIQGLR